MDKIEPLDWSQEELNPESPSNKEEKKQSPLSLRKQETIANFRNFVKRKSIVKKTGLETLYVVKKHQMEELQMSKALNGHEKQYLKENQFNFKMIEYIPGQQDGEEDDAKSIDLLPDEDTANIPDDGTPHGHKESALSFLFSKHESERNLKQIIRKVLESKKEKSSTEPDQDQPEMYFKKTKITVREMMEDFSEGKFRYMKHLIAFLKSQRPLEYNQFPAFYDHLGEALIKMNEESVEGLEEVYELCTIWLQRDYPGIYPTNSKFSDQNDEHVFCHHVGEPLRERYCSKRKDVQKWLRKEPEGVYTNEALVASFQIPLNVAYGSVLSLKMLKSLQKCRNQEVFKIPVVQGFLNFKWDQVKYYLLGEAIVHISFLVTFNIFAVNSDARDSPGVRALLVLFCFIFFCREVLQIIGRKFTYFLDPFNYPDFLSIFCVLFSASDTGHSGSALRLRWTVVLGLLFLYSRSISYFRLWGRTRHLIRSIVETIVDMVPFVLIMIVLIFAFASGYIASHDPQVLGSLDYELRLFKGFELMLGSYEPPQNGPEYLVFIVMAMLMLIVLLNMLIAIMADTFSRVQSNTQVYDYRERLEVNIDLESMIYVCARKKRKFIHIGVARRANAFEKELDQQQQHNRLIRKLVRLSYKKIKENNCLLSELKELKSK